MDEGLSQSEFKETYHSYIWRKVIFIILIIVGLFVLSIYSITVSARDITFVRGIEAIWNHLTDANLEFNTTAYWDEYIVWNNCMPRVLAGIITGAGLAACGAAMQTVLRNPLAEPYTLGISSGAVFGASLAIILGFSVAGAGQYAVVSNAFVFGLIPSIVIIMLIGMMKGLSPVTMILAGTAISYFFGGLTSLMMVMTDDDTMYQTFQWEIGSLGRINGWNNLLLMATGTVVCSIGLMYLSKYLNALAQGDKTAIGLGVDVDKIRYLVLILSTFIVAVLLSFTGIIGFVGLLAPHMVRMIIGGDNKYVIPGAMALGALILLFADTIARLISSVGLPVGAIMMFIGSPIFLYIMLSKRNRSVLY